jgi:hypothetical protein
MVIMTCGQPPDDDPYGQYEKDHERTGHGNRPDKELDIHYGGILNNE